MATCGGGVHAGGRAVTRAVVAAAALVALVALGASGPGGAAPAAAVTGVPARLSATPSTVQLGERVLVGAYDLAPSTDYQVQVCGNGGFGSSAECNLAATTTAATSEIGHFAVELLVARPPAPCPCVVKAVPLVGTGGLTEQELSTPITILGVPVATPVTTPANEASSGLVVERAVLVGSSSWAEWFGATPHRTLVVLLRDAGRNLIPSTPFVLRSGKAANPDQVVATPAVPPLYPNQVVAYRVPVTFPAASFGHYAVVGTLGSTGQIVTFTSGVTLVPWGIVVILAVVVLVVVWLVVRAFVRRRRRRRGDAAASPGPTAGGPVAAAADPPAPGAATTGDGDGATGSLPVAAVASSGPEAPGAP